MITREQLTGAGMRVVELAAHYKGAPHREMRLDGLVYGLLHERFGVERQHKIRSRNRKSNRSQRIDFRQPGLNSVVIELATRTPGRNEVYGSQNTEELRKLSRQTRASMRYLLLLDVSGHNTISQSDLQSTYDDLLKERGRGARRSVRVVYVHPDAAYDFLWRPRNRG